MVRQEKLQSMFPHKGPLPKTAEHLKNREAKISKNKIETENNMAIQRLTQIQTVRERKVRRTNPFHKRVVEPNIIDSGGVGSADGHARVHLPALTVLQLPGQRPKPSFEVAQVR